MATSPRRGLLSGSFITSREVRTAEMLFGYLLGPFGALLSYGIFTSILQNYLTDVLQLDLAFLTGLQLASTLLIVAANLVAGQLIEHTRSLAGKARPWILLSALAVSLSSVLLFVMPFSGAARMVWVAVAYNLYYAVAYPIYNTANSTLLAVSTRDSQKRSTLASLTNIAQLGTMGIGSMVFPLLVSFTLKNDQRRWFLAMLAVGIFSALTILLQFRFTRERVTEETFGCQNSESQAPTLAQQLRAAASQRWWWLILLFYLIFQMGGAMKNGSMAYFCKWVVDNSFFGSPDAWGASQSLLGVLGAVPMAVAAAFVVPLANRFGKQKVTLAGLIIGVAGGVLAGLGNGQIVPVAVGVALKCLGSAPACYLILAMLADAIDHVEYTAGIRTDGLTMSIYSAIMVAATPLCNAAFSALLAASGYDQSADVALGIAAQPAMARAAINTGYIWVETTAFLLGAILIFFFTVEKVLPQEQAAIAARKK